MANWDIHRIVVEHQDRASRFGVASIQTLLAMQDRGWSSSTLLTPLKTSLLGGFVAIITAFAARLSGRRRAKRTTAHVLAALQQNGEDA